MTSKPKHPWKPRKSQQTPQGCTASARASASEPDPLADPTSERAEGRGQLAPRGPHDESHDRAPASPKALRPDKQTSQKRGKEKRSSTALTPSKTHSRALYTPSGCSRGVQVRSTRWRTARQKEVQEINSTPKPEPDLVSVNTTSDTSRDESSRAHGSITQTHKNEKRKRNGEGTRASAHLLVLQSFQTFCLMKNSRPPRFAKRRGTKTATVQVRRGVT